MENSRENVRESGKGHNPLGGFPIVMMGPAMRGKWPQDGLQCLPCVWPMALALTSDNALSSSMDKQVSHFSRGCSISTQEKRFGGEKFPSRPHSEGEKVKYKQKSINQMVFQTSNIITLKVWRLEEKELATNF